MKTELEHFISRYRRRDSTDSLKAPDLNDSLVEFAKIHSHLESKGRLPSPCRCLIEGYAAQGNAQSLRDYLVSRGVKTIDILAVDLYDLPSVYARMGYELPPLRFQIGDARDLRGIVMDASVDLVIQDFLVNCVHPGDVSAIFREMKRVLAPDGFAFVSFTDDACTRDVAEIEPAVSAGSVNFHDQVPVLHDSDVWQQFQGRRFRVVETDGWGFVTRPYGRLEFFSPLESTLSTISIAGIEVLARSVNHGMDDHGLRCVRHRCILGHSPPQGGAI